MQLVINISISSIKDIKECYQKCKKPKSGSFYTSKQSRFQGLVIFKRRKVTSDASSNRPLFDTEHTIWSAVPDQYIFRPVSFHLLLVERLPLSVCLFFFLSVFSFCLSFFLSFFSFLSFFFSFFLSFFSFFLSFSLSLFKQFSICTFSFYS